MSSGSRINNFKTHENPARRMLDRWTGETRFKIKAADPSAKRSRADLPDVPRSQRESPKGVPEAPSGADAHDGRGGRQAVLAMI